MLSLLPLEVSDSYFQINASVRYASYSADSIGAPAILCVFVSVCAWSDPLWNWDIMYSVHSRSMAISTCYPQKHAVHEVHPAMS